MNDLKTKMLIKNDILIFKRFLIIVAKHKVII